MENSAYDAVIIAVNTLIFMVAVSIGMLLMTTVNRMVEYTKQISDSEIGGNLIQEFGDIQIEGDNGSAAYYLTEKLGVAYISTSAEIEKAEHARNIEHINEGTENAEGKYLLVL